MNKVDGKSMHFYSRANDIMTSKEGISRDKSQSHI